MIYDYGLVSLPSTAAVRGFHAGAHRDYLTAPQRAIRDIPTALHLSSSIFLTMASLPPNLSVPQWVSYTGFLPPDNMLLYLHQT